MNSVADAATDRLRRAVPPARSSSSAKTGCCSISSGIRTTRSRVQFEDQFGIGWQNARHAVGLVYMHYSNGGFDKPNHGIDLVLFSYSLTLD
ncbi:acyloxyacyl hydrolase [Thiohalophilus sp.]|uniref:acyloxyacyl hydrolase n=1 Tax=Thiohalophilus sp. TaxID=3028392 RepID=UPI002ACD955D|nr:acyloxyacyl hydrolase [Thiohalophilus sp.]MDZ7660968.1 acyloxyacyl hydrolase [Thiohalophilus sp.]